MLSCSIWFSVLSLWMGGGLESGCVGRSGSQRGFERQDIIYIHPSWKTTINIFVFSQKAIFYYLTSWRNVSTIRPSSGHLYTKFETVYLQCTLHLVFLTTLNLMCTAGKLFEIVYKDSLMMVERRKLVTSNLNNKIFLCLKQIDLFLSFSVRPLQKKIVLLIINKPSL